MTAPRTADLTIRGANGRMRATVFWPAGGGRRTPAALVLFSRSWLGAPDVGPSEALCGAICSAAGMVALRLRWRESDGYDSAVRDATTAIEWVADHAAELGADPSRLVVAGTGDAADVVAEVVRAMRQTGWPAIAHQIFVDPPDPARADRHTGVVAAEPNEARQPHHQGEVS